MTISPKTSGFRALIVGFGSIGKRHAKNLRALFPGVEICVLRSGSGASASENEHTVFDMQSALAFKPDFAVICNPASLHLSVAESLAKSGVHLLIEKPLADRVPGTDALMAAVSEQSLTAMVAYNLRFSPALQAMRASVQQCR